MRLGPLALKNPVMTASGTFGFGAEWADFYDIGRLGAIMVKAVTVHPREGNPMPRMVETAAGMLNSIGLQNPGLEAFINEKMTYLRQFDCAVIVNIAADRAEDYCTLAERLDTVPGVAALEVNISCPNQEHGGMEFGIDPDLTRMVVSRVRQVTRLPLIVKLSPNVTDITELARAARDGGADALFSSHGNLHGEAEEAVIRLSRVGYDNTIGYLAGGLEAWKAAGKEIDQLEEVDAETFATQYLTDHLHLLDARKESEYNSQHIEGATNFPLDFITDVLVPFTIRDRTELSYVLEPAAPTAEEREEIRARAREMREKAGVPPR